MVQGSNPCVLIKLLVMSQVDISMFSSIVQTVCVFGLVIYSFWLVSIYFFFINILNIFSSMVNKSVQLITLLFNRF